MPFVVALYVCPVAPPIIFGPLYQVLVGAVEVRVTLPPPTLREGYGARESAELAFALRETLQAKPGVLTIGEMGASPPAV